MGNAVAMVLVTALITVFLRAFPFLVFGGNRKVPAVVTYLGKVLPPAIMVILVVYCVKTVDFFAGSHGIPELVSILVVVLLHVWKKNTLLSIGAGTVLYMVFVQLVF